MSNGFFPLSFIFVCLGAGRVGVFMSLVITVLVGFSFR